MRKAFLSLFLTLLISSALAQVGKNTSVRLKIVPNANGTISLTWPAKTFTGNWNIYKRINNGTSWPSSPTATVTSNLNSWTDATFKKGESSEYLIWQVNNTGGGIALGYVFAGNTTAEIPSYGSIILLIDSNYIKPLAADLSLLKKDLESNGWLVNTLYAGRKESVVSVRNKVRNFYNAASIKPRSLYIIGHVPVPYSGSYRNIDSATACAYPPDGHIEGVGNHTGAWPSDLIYGDLGGTYSDNSAYCKTGPSRMWNIPGDGKYDQCKVAQEVELEIGRVDLFDMPVFSKNDTNLVRNYLAKAHLWRKDSIKTVERGLIDDNFTTISLARTGWLCQSSMVPYDSIFDNRDYFTAQNSQPYLWSYGCGAGSYTTCSGVGSSSNYNAATFKNIFTATAGSFFGDWDVQNNFLRSPLAAGSLCNFWGGIPTWFNHYMGLGYPIGHGAMYSQNAKDQDFNGSENGLYIALMGDPTSRVRNVPPAEKLKVTIVSNKINLNWRKAKGVFDGYCIYKIDTITNTWTRVNIPIITDTFYSDAANWKTGKYKYAVRTIRLETNPSGSWYNLGGGSFAWINYTNSVKNFQPLAMQIYPNPTTGKISISTDEATDVAVQITVTDIAGKTVLEAIENSVGGTIQLTMPSHLKGNYFVRCNINGRSGVNKIIINP